jgi:hypothetical protein
MKKISAPGNFQSINFFGQSGVTQKIFMHKKSGFFALLSSAIMGGESYSSASGESLLPNEQKTLVTLTNQYQRLFDRLDNLEPGNPSTLAHSDSLAKQYAAVFSAYQEDIEFTKYFLSKQQDLAGRYERLLQKYAQKLNQNNLSDKQRCTYEKFYHQYAQLYKQHST